MDKRLYAAFDKIRAEDELRQNTADFLRDRIRGRSEKSRKPTLRLTAAFACILLCFITGWLSHALYFTPAAYVDIDVNPSVELTMNRFGRVLEARPYNDGGARVLSELDIRHMSYERAVGELVDAMIAQGYLSQDALVSVTVQASDEEKQAELMSAVKLTVDTSLESHHISAGADVFPVTAQLKTEAEKSGVTPAKYLAILELLEVDPEATIEGCAQHSISEIRERTRQHGEGHHGSGDIPEEPSGETQPTQNEPETDIVTPSGSGNKHQSGSSGGHHKKGHK